MLGPTPTMLPSATRKIAGFDPRRIELNEQCIAKESGHAEY